MAVIERVYNPSPTGKAFMKSEAFHRFINGPVGSGKSVLCVMEVVRRCKMQRAGPDGKRRSRWAVVRNTSMQLKDTTLKTWYDWIPPGVAGTWRESDKMFILDFDDVYAEILFRPLDRPEDVQRVLSLELTGVWLNECREIPMEVVDALDGRLRRYPSQANGGASWSGMIADTNPPEDNSPWAEVFKNPAKNTDVFMQPSGLSPDAENLENLHPDYYIDLCTGKSQDWIDIYVHGKFGRSLSGTPVYEQTYDQRLHCVDNIPVLPEQLVIVGMDFGLNPAAIITQLHDQRPSQLNVLHECTALNMTMTRFVDEMLMPVLVRRFNGCPVIVIGDPTGVNRQGTDGNTAFRFLMSKGLACQPASTNSIEPRIQAVEYFLSRLVHGQPALQIDMKNCGVLARGFQSGYKYKQVRKGETVAKPDKGDFSHPHDALQYACLFAQSPRLVTSARTVHNRSHEVFREEQPVYQPQVW